MATVRARVDGAGSVIVGNVPGKGVASNAMSVSTTPLSGRRFIGVDVGGSGVKAAAVDLDNGVAHGRIRVETPQPATPDAVTGAIAQLVREFPDHGTIGCTLPAVVLNGTVRTAAHIDESWIGVQAAAVISRA